MLQEPSRYAKVRKGNNNFWVKVCSWGRFGSEIILRALTQRYRIYKPLPFLAFGECQAAAKLLFLKDS